MGGGAFLHAAAKGEPTLTTPRLTPDQYGKLKAIYLKKLQDYFPGTRIACPTEAPEKADYGDMDILIAMDGKADFIDMANFLGAAGIISHRGGQNQKCTLGVPIDGSPHTRPAIVYNHVNENSGRKTEPSATMTVDDYAQIDVAIVQPDILEWYTFQSSYGDMTGLLGHIMHPLGFTITDVGMWLRDELLDFSKTVDYVNIAERDGRIFLSKDTDLVMEFLGLPATDYHNGFKTLDALYKWLGKCRLISPHAIKLKRDNSHERKWEEKRTVYSKFFYEWLPAHQKVDQELVDASESEEDRKRAQTETIRKLRRKWCEEAVDFFDKRTEYETMHRRLRLATDNGLAAELLNPMISKCSEKEGKLVREILRGFRRYVAFDTDGQPYVLDKPHSDEDSQLHNFLGDDRQSLRDPEGTYQWVLETWDELRALERRRFKVGD